MEGGWGAFLGVVVSYSVLNFVLQSIIQPKVAGDAVGVVPTVSFLSLLFWAWVLGPLGAILALPCTLLVKAVLIDADPGSRWVNSLIASDLKGMEMRQSSLLALLRRPKDVVGSHAAGEDADAGSVSLDAAAQERVRLAAREAEREGGPSSPLMSPRVDGVSPPEPERGTPGAAGGAAGR